VIWKLVGMCDQLRGLTLQYLNPKTHPSRLLDFHPIPRELASVFPEAQDVFKKRSMRSNRDNQDDDLHSLDEHEHEPAWVILPDHADESTLLTDWIRSRITTTTTTTAIPHESKQEPIPSRASTLVISDTWNDTSRVPRSTVVKWADWIKVEGCTYLNDLRPTLLVIHLPDYFVRRGPPQEHNKITRRHLDVVTCISSATRLVVVSHVPHPDCRWIRSLLEHLHTWPYYNTEWWNQFQVASSSQRPATLRALHSACDWSLWKTAERVTEPKHTQLNTDQLCDLVRRVVCECKDSMQAWEHDKDALQWSQQVCKQTQLSYSEWGSVLCRRLWKHRNAGVEGSPQLDHLFQDLEFVPVTLRLIQAGWIRFALRCRTKWFKVLCERCTMILSFVGKDTVVLALQLLLPDCSTTGDTTKWSEHMLNMGPWTQQQMDAWVVKSTVKLKTSCPQFLADQKEFCQHLMDLSHSWITPSDCAWQPQWEICGDLWCGRGLIPDASSTTTPQNQTCVFASVSSAQVDEFKSIAGSIREVCSKCVRVRLWDDAKVEASHIQAWRFLRCMMNPSAEEEEEEDFNVLLCHDETIPAEQASWLSMRTQLHFVTLISE
jgi:hypothetical protein